MRQLWNQAAGHCHLFVKSPPLEVTTKDNVRVANVKWLSKRDDHLVDPVGVPLKSDWNPIICRTDLFATRSQYGGVFFVIGIVEYDNPHRCWKSDPQCVEHQLKTSIQF